MKKENQEHPNRDAQLENNWRKMRNAYIESHPNLTEEDVHYKEGEFDKMTQHIAEKINQSREQLRDQIQNWSGRDDIQTNYEQQR